MCEPRQRPKVASWPRCPLGPQLTGQRSPQGFGGGEAPTGPLHRRGAAWHPASPALPLPHRPLQPCGPRGPWKSPGHQVPPARCGLARTSPMWPRGSSHTAGPGRRPVNNPRLSPCALPGSHPSPAPAAGRGQLRGRGRRETDRQKDRWRQGGPGDSLAVTSPSPVPLGVPRAKPSTQGLCRGRSSACDSVSPQIFAPCPLCLTWEGTEGAACSASGTPQRHLVLTRG